ncbi:MAG TPA: TonB-dependent receptor [Vicinamibacterales bacterium]|nr:TonB-dependent receptor [Vicinamibacterales bacterium]
MTRVRGRFCSILFLAGLLMALGAPAYAQGGSSTLVGTVVDSSGAFIPGADVVAKNNATATEYRTVTDSAGRYAIPAIGAGTYTVTVSLAGFKTVILPDIEVIANTPASVKAVVLELGSLQESVTVTGATELVQTQTASVTTTLTTQQISRAPLTTRNTLDFVTMLPGVNQTQAPRYSTIMGLPGGALNITIDGLNVQDQALKSQTSSAFFAYINPRLDAVEEVTVSTANPGAESSGQGAVQVRFQTRSGTNTFQGSVYHYMRRTQWNTNYWFNQHQNYPALPNDKARIDTFGGRVGGPILKDRLFFFFNYEEFRQPQSVSRTRTVLTPESLAGKMVYVGGPAGGVDLFALAAANGQTSTYDPSMKKILEDINATLSGQSITAGSNSVTNTLTFQTESTGRRIYPTGRIDLNLTKKNRIGVSGYLQRFISKPDMLNSRDPAYPGYKMQGNQTSWRPSVMFNWRSVLGANLVNEARVGYMGWKGTHFSDNITPGDFPGGRHIVMPLINRPYMIGGANNYEIRSSPALNIENTLNWIKGRHSLSFGGAFTQVGYNDYFKYYVPYVALGFDTTNDPAAGMFNTANFPGASSADLSNARNLYALLTGRVTSLNNTAFLNPDTGKYEYMGPWQYWVKQKEFGFYAQDSWKITSNLTINYGLRYQLQLPFTSANKFFTQLSDYNMLYGISGATGGKPNYFYSGTPGTGSGVLTVKELKAGEAPFDTDWNNLAPSVGFAWRVPITPGSAWSKILSDDPVVRAGYSKSYTREGLSATSNIFAANPGGSIQVFRNQTLGNLIPAGQSWPLLYRETDRLGAPPFPESPSYPLNVAFSNSINAFAADTPTPWVHSFNVGFQRAITKSMAMEIRYVGTRARGGWVDGGRNINELNILENGFIDEFKRAQANRQINAQTYGWGTAAGNSFKYNGLPGQSPLPIYQAFFSGKPASTAGNPAEYTSAAYGNTTYLGYHTPTNPLPGTMAALFFSDATYRANGIAAGYPANFFYMNPGMSGGAWVTGREQDALQSNYDAVQIELRRRMSSGLLAQASYQYILRQQSTQNITVREDPMWVDLERGRSEGSSRHAFKINWVWELPFGQGKRFASGVSRGLNLIIGGWTFDGTGRIQSGPILDFGNVRLVGMSDADLKKLFKLRIVPDRTNPRIKRVFMLPDDVIDNTILAFSTSYNTASGYSGAAPQGRYFAPIGSGGCLQPFAGACGENGRVTGRLPNHHYVTGPMFMRWDMSLAKRIGLTRKINAELRLEALNVFDRPNFFGVTTTGGTAWTSYQVTGAYRDFNNTQDPGGRLVQVSWRLNF